ncbi:MAG TPA: cytochrome c maturation protein CcmE, partial [candidate division Zixibacteria bacterium]|nr:cytochrome c maturation protein CcmE [candidate division Zixibacteria bacterium]
VYSFWNTQVSSVTIANAKQSEHTVQVTGEVDFATMNYDIDKQRLEFDLMEPEGAANGHPERLHVVFYGEVPGNFEQATSVTVIGKNGDDGFVADNMLVKCPSKYQGEDGEEHDYDSDEVRSYEAQTT